MQPECPSHEQYMKSNTMVPPIRVSIREDYMFQVDLQARNEQ
jgi:hypothetical protein